MVSILTICTKIDYIFWLTGREAWRFLTDIRVSAFRRCQVWAPLRDRFRDESGFREEQVPLLVGDLFRAESLVVEGKPGDRRSGIWTVWTTWTFQVMTLSVKKAHAGRVRSCNGSRKHKTKRTHKNNRGKPNVVNGDDEIYNQVVLVLPYTYHCHLCYCRDYSPGGYCSRRCWKEKLQFVLELSLFWLNYASKKPFKKNNLKDTS